MRRLQIAVLAALAALTQQAPAAAQAYWRGGPAPWADTSRPSMIPPPPPKSYGGAAPGEACAHMDGGDFSTCAPADRLQAATHYQFPDRPPPGPARHSPFDNPVFRANLFYNICGNAAGCLGR
jgi:hypothetical protein